jgi:hypothetical protein
MQTSSRSTTWVGRESAVEHLIAQSTAPADSPPRRVVLPIALIVRGSGEVKP